MIITCPQCKTRYRLAEHLLKDQGGKVRCSRCSHVFQAPPPAAAGRPALSEQGSPPDQGAEEPFRNETEPNASSAKKPARRLSLLLLVLLLVLLLIGAGYLYFPQIKSRLPFSGDASQPGSLSQKEDSALSDLSQITFTDVRQYMVDNEKIGKLLIIEGKAVNESSVPVEMIKIQSEIFDENGNSLQRKSFYCGNTLSLFQLQVLNQKEMESALKSKVGVLTNNSNLGPEQEVSFMTIFYNPPEAMAEFSLKVVQATPVSQD